MTNPLALIIEDDPKLADIFAFAVQKAGFETEIIYNGAIALPRLKVTTPALVVLDLHLPQVSGEEILERIQADKRLVETKVIVASADLNKANMLRGEVEAVLFKPIDFHQLRIMAASLRPR